MIFLFRPLNFNDLQKIKDRSISIEVKGELDNPGIFQIKPQSTLDELMKELQLKEDSDISHLNLNQILLNKDVVIIRKVSPQALVSINSASVNELSSLPGIGLKIAQRIIDYRETHGFFQALEDLKNVKGIGDKVYEKLSAFITL